VSSRGTPRAASSYRRPELGLVRNVRGPGSFASLYMPRPSDVLELQRPRRGVGSRSSFRARSSAAAASIDRHEVSSRSPLRRCSLRSKR
jgi:hypothetical protein